mmetsp:Transcript_42749/g.118034  ORF Transcript_42749/g.118034 Transcript_42749/m.118034 type:complete len:249 (+) Transcript_42749:363-1109(+)
MDGHAVLHRHNLVFCAVHDEHGALDLPDFLVILEEVYPVTNPRRRLTECHSSAALHGALQHHATDLVVPHCEVDRRASTYGASEGDDPAGVEKPHEVVISRVDGQDAILLGRLTLADTVAAVLVCEHVRRTDLGHEVQVRQSLPDVFRVPMRIKDHSIGAGHTSANVHCRYPVTMVGLQVEEVRPREQGFRRPFLRRNRESQIRHSGAHPGLQTLESSPPRPRHECAPGATRRCARARAAAAHNPTHL